MSRLCEEPFDWLASQPLRTGWGIRPSDAAIHSLHTSLDCRASAERKFILSACKAVEGLAKTKGADFSHDVLKQAKLTPLRCSEQITAQLKFGTIEAVLAASNPKARRN